VNERKERPILFSGPMVRAILEGRKTQTRRVVKPQPPADHPFPQPCVNDGYWWNDSKDDHDDVSFWPTYSTCLPCPYGKPGDRLWVRETFSTWHHGCQWHDCTREGRSKQSCSNLFYRSTHHFSDDDQRWVPSIFMPRWASRITLEITSVRVERLGDISGADAIAEGAERPVLSATELDGIPVHPMAGSYADGFRDLWESINGPESWAANPWVWVVEFQEVQVAR
jgi:hypothetical protein